MRLIRAELLKIRRRQATWVLFGVLIAIMAVFFLLIGGPYFRALGIVEFPQTYGLIQQFAFAFGGLFGIVFAAAYVGADWNWGVVRNVVARGESRASYLLAKAAALGIVLAVALVIIFLVGILMALLMGPLSGVPVASPLRGDGLLDLAKWLVIGYPVLLQRALLGLFIAVLLRSQLPGAVLGIVLFLGESLLTTILTVATFTGGLFDPDNGGFGGFQPADPQWFQLLPISIGGNVFSALPGGGGVASEGGLQNLLIKPVPFEIALIGIAVYIVASLGLAIVAINRQEIAG